MKHIFLIFFTFLGCANVPTAPTPDPTPSPTVSPEPSPSPSPVSTAPKIDWIIPDKGYVTGGKLVMMQGTNLIHPISIKIGGTSCASIHLSGSGVQCDTGISETSGLMDVSVTANGETTVVPKAFTYEPLPAEAPNPFGNTTCPEGETVNGSIFIGSCVGSEFIYNGNNFYSYKPAPMNHWFIRSCCKYVQQ